MTNLYRISRTFTYEESVNPSEAETERPDLLEAPFRGEREICFYLQPTGPNPHNHRDELSGPALRHGGLNFLSQVALYLPSSNQTRTSAGAG